MGNFAQAMNDAFGSDDDSLPSDVVFAVDELSVAPSAVASAEIATMPFQKLEENIKRVQYNLNSPNLKLPDGGQKLRKNLAQMQDELNRRGTRVSSRSKQDNQANQKASRPPKPGIFDWHDEIKSNKYGPLPISNFYNKGSGAFKRELSLIGREKRKTGEKNNQKNSTLKEWPSRSLSDNNCTKVHVAGYDKINSSCTFGKRMKIPKIQGSSNSDIKEVKNVVLLDDEDVETIDPSSKDIPEKWKECKMYYPSKNDKEAIELSYSDIKCLDPAQYLSSPLMNFYIHYLKRSLSRASKLGIFYIFNTYFYQKLEDAFNAKDDHDSMFMKLRRWFKGVNIFEKSYIILPIHGRMHWSLVIICIPEKESQSGPFVLHLDSLGCHSSSSIFDTIEWCLRKEWKHVCENSPKINLNKIHKEKVSVPQQKNEYDCGLFVLYFIERFTREVPERFTTSNLDMFNRKWFKAEEASGLRQRLRALLIEELESVRLENENIISDANSVDSDSS